MREVTSLSGRSVPTTQPFLPTIAFRFRVRRPPRRLNTGLRIIVRSAGIACAVIGSESRPRVKAIPSTVGASSTVGSSRERNIRVVVSSPNRLRTILMRAWC